MSFLYPLFLAGALGVAAPLWLHLRRRQRQNVKFFSALRFLDDQPAPRDMPLELRDLPLLLLRALALLLLIAAFAWPFFALGGARESETRVYVLDNTLSHRVDGAFERARDEIAAQIRRAGPEMQVGVVEIAARARVVADFGVTHEEAAAAVAALQPTYQRGNYLEAFRLAAALLDRSLGAKRTLYVYGDRQRNQWEENINVPPFLRDVEVVLAEAPGKNGQGNLYISNARVARVPYRGGSAANLMLDVGAQSVNQTAQIAIRAGDDEILRRDLSLSGPVTSIQSAWDTAPPGWIRGEVAIEGRPDVLPYDNKSYFAVPPLNTGRIGLMARSPYLRTALDPEIMRGFWDVTVLGPGEIQAEAAATKPRFDALVVESDFLQSKEVRDLVFKHLNNGRGIVLFLSRPTPLVEGFLRSVNFRIVGEKELPEDQQAFRYANLNHPVLEPFARPDFGDLLAVRVKKYLQLEAEKADGLLFAGSGDAVLFETKETKGKMLVFGFGGDTAASNWPLRPDFLPFLDHCLRYVRAASDLQTSVEPGEMYFREFEDAANATFILARDEKELSRATADDKGRLRIAAPDEPGVYDLRRVGASGASTVEGLLSVSPSEKESQLDYIEGRPAILDAWSLTSAPSAAPAVPEETTQAIVADGLVQRWWWYLLAGGAALLVAEMAWLLGRRKLG